jgi:hypothetical protein
MKIRRTADFDRDYAAAAPAVQRAFDKQLRLFMQEGPRYPSLQVHPWPKDGPDAMQARVTIRARFYYRVDSDTYVIYRLREEHPKSPKRGR